MDKKTNIPCRQLEKLLNSSVNPSSTVLHYLSAPPPPQPKEATIGRLSIGLENHLDALWVGAEEALEQLRTSTHPFNHGVEDHLRRVGDHSQAALRQAIDTR